MEHARLFIAIVLSLLVFVVWNYFFVDKKPNQMPKQAIQAEQQAGKKPELQGKEKVVKEVPPLKASAPLKEITAESTKPSKTITVNLPLYTVKISEKGAVFKSFILKNYKSNFKAGFCFRANERRNLGGSCRGTKSKRDGLSDSQI